MVQGPDFSETATTIVGGPGATSGRGLAIMAPHVPSGDQVSANVVKKLKLQRFADAYFGAGSLLAEGFRAAKNSGVKEVLLVGVAPRVGSPFTETFGANPGPGVTTGTLTAANMPIRKSDITTLSRDGVNILPNLVFTKNTGAALTGMTVAAGAIAINGFTGEYKLGTATTGNGAGLIVTYASHDRDEAIQQLDLNDYEYLQEAGATFGDDHHGVNQYVLQHAFDFNKMMALAFPSGALPADVKAAVEAQAATMSARSGGDGDGRLMLLGAYYTGDLTCALAGQLASRPVNSTRKLQKAPAGVTYTGSYTKDDFGSELEPVDGTFHEMGANAVYQTDTGAYEISNDRSCTTIDSKMKFHSTARMVRRAETDIDKRLLVLRRSSDISIAMSQSGILAISNVLESICGQLRNEGIIDQFNVESPDIEDIPQEDRSNRLLDYFDVRVRLTGQVHFIRLSLQVQP